MAGLYTLTQRMVIDGFGNVGIGTTTPGASLDIVNPDGGDILQLRSRTNVNSTGLKLSGNSGDTAAIRAKFTNPTGNTGTELQFYTNSMAGLYTLTQRMVIDGSGNVGIGTSSPAAMLHVVGNV